MPGRASSVTGETSGAAAAGKPQAERQDGAGSIPGVAGKRAEERGHPRRSCRPARRQGEGVRSPQHRRFAGRPVCEKNGAAVAADCDAARDWTPAEVVALLDDIAAVTDDSAGDHDGGSSWPHRSRPACRCPVNWPAHRRAGRPSGPAHGLAAGAAHPQYRLGTPLKSRILLHNSGRRPGRLPHRTWNQSGGHKATDAKGADIKVESIEWTTLASTRDVPARAGEFVEVSAAGIGVGAVKNDKDWQNTRVGSWIDAKAGDDVTFMPAVVPLSDWKDRRLASASQAGGSISSPHACSAATPLPADKTERERLLYRVAIDLFGTRGQRRDNRHVCRRRGSPTHRFAGETPRPAC